MSEESSNSIFERRHGSRMDPMQPKLPDEGQNSGGNPAAYQGGWNPYMFGYQFPPTSAWFLPGGMHPPPSAAMTQPGATAAVLPPRPNVPCCPAQSENPLGPVVEEVQVMTGHGPQSSGRKKRDAGRTKLQNFSPEEDVNLVKAWLEISCHPITNTGQWKDRFWGRVEARYNARMGLCPERSLRSIQSRWDSIKCEVAKFAGFLSNVVSANASGMSDADKTTHVAAMYASVAGHSFQYMHCWDIMKDEPKWQDIAYKGARAGAFPGFGDQTPQDSNTIDLEGDEPSPTASSGKWPIGRDAVKSARKKNVASSSTSSSEYASKMQDLSLQKISIWQEENSQKVSRFAEIAAIEEKRFEEMREHNKSLLLLEQEKLRIMRDKLEQQARRDEIQRRKDELERQEREKLENERILKVDLDSCTPELRLYYEALREEILEKLAARRQRK